MRTGTWKAAAVAVTLVIAGCGGDDDDDAAEDDVEDATGSDAGSEGEDEGGDEGSAGGGGNAVTMANFAFNPDEISVAAGDSVAVNNEDGSAHTFTSEDGGFDLELAGGESGEVTIEAEPGTYDFLCTIHPSMTGTLTVE